MKKADVVTASKIMNENPVTASADSKLSQVKSKMEEEDIRAIPVVRGDRFEGVIGYRDLIRHLQFNPKKTKLEKVMHQPPEFEEDDSLVELCDLRINSGRKLLVRTEGKKLKGVIGDKEFLKTFKETEELKNISTEDLGTKELVTAFEEDSIEKTRHKMLDNNISRLPVLDKNGKLTGIIRSTDLLRAMVPMESPQAGGASGNRKGSEYLGSGGNEKEGMSNIPVTELMERVPVTSQKHMSSNDAAEKMLEEEVGEIIFTDGQYPKSLVTVKDFINFVEGLKASDTVLVQLIGVDVPEEKAALHDKISKQLRGSLGRKLRNPSELNVHVKKADKDGTKHRYELNVKLHSELGITSIEEEGWELLDALDTALDELNSKVRTEKEKQKEKR